MYEIQTSLKLTEVVFNDIKKKKNIASVYEDDYSRKVVLYCWLEKNV